MTTRIAQYIYIYIYKICQLRFNLVGWLFSAVALLWQLGKLHSPTLRCTLMFTVCVSLSSKKHVKAQNWDFSHFPVLRSTSPRDNIEIPWLEVVCLPYIWRDLNVFALWIVTVADGKGGGIVVYTTDLCTFVLFCVSRYKVKMGSRHL